jgi:hypothetical protein
MITGGLGDAVVIIGGRLVTRAVPSLVGLSAQSVYVQAAAGVVIAALAGVIGGKMLGASKGQLLAAAGISAVGESVLKGLNVPYVSAYLGDAGDDLAVTLGTYDSQLTYGGYPSTRAAARLAGYPPRLSGYGAYAKTASEDVVAESFGDGDAVALSSL